jgi:hypothetical protein
MVQKYVRAQVLGSSTVVEVPIEFFTQAMRDARIFGRFLEDPAPFIAPCTDGLLIAFNVFLGPMSVRGHAGLLDRAKLKAFPTLEEVWETAAKKPMTLRGALLHFGFPQPS